MEERRAPLPAVPLTIADRIDRWLGGLVRGLGTLGVIVLLSTLTPLPNQIALLLESQSDLAPADAIVVLGSNIDPDGTLNSPSLRRAIEGLLLYRRGLAPRIVFTGIHLPGRPNEAAARARLAETLGVPAAAILAEDRARTTKEEAEHVAAVLRPVGARRIVLVTASTHLRRARPLFERQGFVVSVAAVQEGGAFSDVPEDRFGLLRRSLAEGAAHLYYRLAGHL